MPGLFGSFWLILTGCCWLGADETPSVRVDRSSVVSLELPPDLGSRSFGADWPGFLGPTGDSKSSEQGIATSWPETGLPIVWAAASANELRGTHDQSRTALSFRTRRRPGKTDLHEQRDRPGALGLRVPYRLRGHVRLQQRGRAACPVVDGPRVYLFGAEGMLHCVRAVDGGLLWKVDTKARFGVVQNFFGVGSTPAVEGDQLIVQVGGSPPGSPAIKSGDVVGNGSGIVSFDKYTRARSGTSLPMSWPATPARCWPRIGQRRWCFVFARGGLVGFNPATGKLDFHYPWRARILFQRQRE